MVAQVNESLANNPVSTQQVTAANTESRVEEQAGPRQQETPSASSDEVSIAASDFENPQSGRVDQNNAITQAQLNNPSSIADATPEPEDPGTGDIASAQTDSQQLREDIQAQSDEALAVQANQRPEVALNLLS